MTALETLNKIPRLDLRGFTSPVQLLERFSQEIGVEVWCKRDDIGTVGLAGNKVRKLEVELAYALASGATHLVAEGSRLSNATYLSFAQGGARLLGAQLDLTRDHINITEDYLGDGYGLPLTGIYEAIDLLACKEGVVVDPIYSGKAVAAIIDLASKNELKGPVVFWHTGGYHAVFDPNYAKRIWSSIGRLATVTL